MTLSTNNKKSTSDLLLELRASGYTPFVDNFKDAETAVIVDGGCLRVIGQLNTLKLAKYLMRQ